MYSSDYFSRLQSLLQPISLAEEVSKTPTIAFRVEGIPPQEVCQKMCEHYSIFLADGDFYAMTLAQKLGIRVALK